MTKRILAILLAMLMVLSLAACGEKQEEAPAVETEKPVESEAIETPKEETPEAPVEEAPKEPVTITFWYRNGVGEQQYTEQVEEKLNEILDGIEGYEHISMDLKPVAKSYGQAFTLAQSSGEQIDLVSTYGLGMTTLVQNGDFMALDALLGQYPNVTSELPSWLVDMGKLFGEQYYIPTYQQATTQYFWEFPEEYLNMYLDAERITKDDFREILQSGSYKMVMDTLEDYVLTIRELTGLTLYASTANKELAPYFSREYIGGDYGKLVLREGSDKVVWEDMEADVEYILGRYAEWYQKGLLHPDSLTIKEKDFARDNSMVDGGMAYFFASAVATEDMMYETQSYTNKQTYVAVRDHCYIGSVYAAGGVAVYADCEHPDEAMMILELLNTKKGEEFYNTLVWGLENIHWEWVDEASDRIKTLEYDGSQGNSNSTYHAWKWNVGNSFNAWDNQAVAVGQDDFVLSVHDSEETIKSPAMGMTWDTSEISDQLSQCNAIKDEYSFPSIYTADDWKARYDEYMEKLELAGINEITANLQAQFDAFLASK